MKKKPKTPRAVIGTVLVFVVLLSVFMAGHDLWRQKQAQDTFEDLAELVTAPEDPEESQAESSAPEESTEAQEPQEGTRNLSLLFEQNADCIGWVCIPGTAVDYPLMHTPEDSEKYLRKDFYGAYSVSGVPFLDGRCSLESANLIIYGHNMNNGTMFGSLKKYKDDGFWKENQYFTVYSETTAYRYRIFSYEDAVNGGDVYKVGYQPGEEYQKFIDQMIKDSDVDTGVNPQTSNKILTLSTCTGNGYSKRLAIHAVCVDAQTTDESKLKEKGN